MEGSEGRGGAGSAGRAGGGRQQVAAGTHALAPISSSVRARQTAALSRMVGQWTLLSWLHV